MIYRWASNQRNHSQCTRLVQNSERHWGAQCLQLDKRNMKLFDDKFEEEFVSVYYHGPFKYPVPWFWAMADWQLKIRTGLARIHTRTFQAWDSTTTNILRIVSFVNSDSCWSSWSVLFNTSLQINQESIIGINHQYSPFTSKLSSFAQEFSSSIGPSQADSSFPALSASMANNKINVASPIISHGTHPNPQHA